MKTINIVNKIVATNLGIDVKIVEKINKAYWKEILINLTEVREEPVHIKKLGTISASPFKTSKYIIHLLNKIKSVKESVKYTDITKERIIRDAKKYLTILLKKRNQFAIENYNKPNERIKRIPKASTNSVS